VAAAVLTVCLARPAQAEGNRFDAELLLGSTRATDETNTGALVASGEFVIRF
jgi:hypothetical protein